jgi:hypothetical protein
VSRRPLRPSTCSPHVRWFNGRALMGALHPCCRYEGKFIEGFRHGKGKFVWNDGARYEVSGSVRLSAYVCMRTHAADVRWPGRLEAEQDGRRRHLPLG